MALLVVEGSRDSGCKTLVFRALRSPWQKLRGLLGTSPDAAPVALMRCSRVHTFGMRYRLDIALVARSGVVLEVWRSVPPSRLVGNSRAHVVLEQPHKRGSWLVAGEVVEMSVDAEGAYRAPVALLSR